jgi:uncharacterized protein YndB with AHSA1/START domain
MTKPLSFTITHRFAQSAEHVFDAWLDVEIARRLMFESGPSATARCEIDAQVGGRYVLADKDPDGEVEHVGHFVEIDRPRRLVFTFCVPSISLDVDIITIEITPQGSGCELQFTCVTKPEWADYVDGARESWAKVLATLGAVLG